MERKWNDVVFKLNGVDITKQLKPVIFRSVKFKPPFKEYFKLENFSGTIGIKFLAVIHLN